MLRRLRSSHLTAMLRTMMFKLSKEESTTLQHGYLTCLRDEYTIIKASGATVLDYLQGQITQDMHQLTENHGIYTAILTPQGKLVSDLYIISGHNRELIIIVRKDYAEALVGRLRQFSLGHELRVGIVDSLKLISIQGVGCDGLLERHDLPLPAEGRLSTNSVAGSETFTIRMAEAADSGVWIVTDDAASLTTQAETMVGEPTIHAARIIRGIPVYGIDWNEKIFPLNANLVEFEGISFEKGCYVGQEVTSRMQWRGGIKKRLFRVQLETLPTTLPCSVSTTVEIGRVTSAALNGDEVFGIAHLPIEIVESRTPLIDPEGDSVQVIGACRA
ncbi:MAG: folate-binding protein [Mariprofundaceae bacterium]|nr:folate-binding protein [Mariprofundaceae bacterium]